MKLRSNPFAAISIALLSASTLHAGVFTWDTTSGDSAIVGGIGTWNTTATTPGPVNTNWTIDAGFNNVSWPAISSGDDDALFGGTGGAVTIESPGITANSVTFTSASYVIGGSPLTLDSLDPDGAGPLLAPAPVISAGPANTQSATINANIVSANGLSKTGGSTLTLGGDLSGVVGTLTIDGAITSPINNAAGIQLQSGVSTSGLTGIDIKNNSFLALGGVSLGASTPIILNGGGGNQAPQGTIRGTAGVNTVAGNITINDANVRLGNTGTSTTFSGAITTPVSTNGLLVRIGSGQGVILTNTGNSWGGTTALGEGSLYCAPGALPSTTALAVGTALAGDYGTNGSFNRALGTAAGEVVFGRANDGQRANGLTARGGALTVNLGNAAADVLFLNTFAKTGATNTTTTVTVDVTNLVAGMSVTGSGIPADTLISTVGTTTITLNKAATSTIASNALTFYAAQNNARINSSVFVLNGGNADSALTFQNPLDLNGFNRFLQVNANTTTLTGGLKNSSTIAAAIRKTGAGTLIHDPGAAHTLTLAGLNTNAGTVELKSGTITVSGSASTSQPDSATGFTVSRGGTFRLNGGNINATSGTYIFPAGNTGGGTNNFILDSGTFNANGREVLNAYGAAGTTTINGGLFICNGFKVTQNTGVLNLNGGILRLNRLYGDANTSTINFNGGTLQARVNSLTFIDTTITNARVQLGGAVIDSNSVNIIVPEALVEDSGSTGGGLTKLGAGSLTLSGANTYTGATSVTLGTLALVGGSQTSPITVNSGAALGFTLGSPTTSTSSVTFSGATAKVTVTGTPVAATLMTASSITGTPVLDPAIPGYALQVTATELKLVASSTPYDTWAALYAPANDVSNPAGDNDNDGLVNQQEFAFGLIPISGSSVNPILAQLDKTTGTFTYQRRAATGLTYKILKSTTLAAGSWTEDAAGQVAGAVDGNGNESVVVTLSGSKPLGDTKLFVRVAAQ